MMRSVRLVTVVASLLLFVATLAMGVRSCDKSDSLNRYRRDVVGANTYHDTTGIFIMRGMIGGGYLRIYPPTTQDWPTDARWRFHTAGANPIPWPHRFSFLGF